MSSSDLLSLGSVVRGVRSSLLRKVEAHGLLGSQGLGRLSQELSTLQKVALLDGVRKGGRQMIQKRETRTVSRRGAVGEEIVTTRRHTNAQAHTDTRDVRIYSTHDSI